jgi:hypothetical protein
MKNIPVTGVDDVFEGEVRKDVVVDRKMMQKRRFAGLAPARATGMG